MNAGQHEAGVGGQFKGADLARAFARLAREKATGVLSVERDGESSRAFLRDGRVAGAVVFGRFKPLGVFLMEAGLIDIGALDRSLSIMARDKIPQGQALLALCAIDEAQLDSGLRDQQLANVAAFLQQETGTWSFEATQALPAWTGDIFISPGVAVLEACRSDAGRHLVRSVLAVLGSTKVRLLIESPEAAERFALHDADARTLRGLDGQAELDELAMASSVELEDLLALVAALHCFELVEAVDGGGDLGELLPETSVEPEAKAEARPHPTTEESQATPATPSETARRPRERGRRSRLLKKAFQNIPGAEALAAKRAAEARVAKEKASASKESAGAESRSEVRERESKRKARMARGRESEEARTFAAEVAKWHGAVGDQDLYRRLRIKRTASAGEVKAGYLSLAKRFHPDRASALGLDADMTGRLHVVFEAVKEAYDVLKDSDERKRYDLRLKEGLTGGGEDRTRLVAAARMQYRKGLVLFKKKDFAGALPLLKQAYAADPKNGAWAVHYAWARYSVGPVVEVKEEILRTLKRAAGGEECADRAYYYLGLIARIDGELDRAERYMNRALRINENMNEAVTELRLIKRRSQRESGTTTSRLMRKILGD